MSCRFVQTERNEGTRLHDLCVVVQLQHTVF